MFSASLSLPLSSVILCLLFSLVLLDRMFSLPVFRLLCRDMFLFYAFLSFLLHVYSLTHQYGTVLHWYSLPFSLVPAPLLTLNYTAFVLLLNEWV